MEDFKYALTGSYWHNVTGGILTEIESLYVTGLKTMLHLLLLVSKRGKFLTIDMFCSLPIAASVI